MADLAVWQRTIVDEKGDIIPGAEVSVRSYPGGSLITLYEGPDGTQVKGNPFSTGADGFARFWAESQRAEIIAHGAGSTIRWIVDLLNADEVIGDAVTEATAAAAAAVSEAKAEADRAEAARDAAQLNARIFPDAAAGLAATTDGDYFSVPSPDDDEYLILYRNDSGGATEVRRYPSAEGVESRTQIAVDLASEPGTLPEEFYGDHEQVGFAFLDEEGNTVAAFDADGRWMAWQPAETAFYDQVSLAYASLDEDGRVLWGVEEGGHFWGKHTRDEFSGGQDHGPALAFAYTDEDGRVLLGFDENGNLIAKGGNEPPDPGGEAAPLLPYVDGTQLHAVGADDKVVADLGSYTALFTAPGNSKSVRAVLDWPAIGPTRSVTAGNGLLVPDADNVLHIVIGLGQSLMVGHSSASSMINTEALYPEDVLMFDAGPNSDVRMGLSVVVGSNTPLDPSTLVGFAPLVAKPSSGGGTFGQTPLESFANALETEARRLGIRYRMLSFTAAQSGAAYEVLKKGTQVYDNMLAAVGKAQQLAEAEGWRVIVDGCILRHGEADADDGSYGTYLLEWQEDIDADIRAITGQQAPVHFVMAQPSSFTGNDTQSAPLMADLHRSSPFHHLAGPDYPFADLYYEDLVHGTGAFYFISGEYLAAAWAQALWSAWGTSSITQITGASRSGTTVTLTYDVPVPPLVFDTALVSERDAKGFRYRDSAGNVPVASVTIIDDGTASGEGLIELSLEATPSGSDEQVLYALSGHSFPREAGNIPRGNVRDSAARVSGYDGRRLYNWAVHQRVDVSIA